MVKVVRIRVKETDEEFNAHESFSTTTFDIMNRGRERISKEQFQQILDDHPKHSGHSLSFEEAYNEYGFTYWTHKIGEEKVYRPNGYYVQTPKWVKLYSLDSVQVI